MFHRFRVGSCDLWIAAALALCVSAAQALRPSVAEAAAPTGHTKDISKLALKQFLAIGYWAANDDGMDRKKLDAMIAVSVKTGGIMAGKEPVKYERLVDPSIWRDAGALVK